MTSSWQTLFGEDFSSRWEKLRRGQGRNICRTLRSLNCLCDMSEGLQVTWTARTLLTLLLDNKYLGLRFWMCDVILSTSCRNSWQKMSSVKKLKTGSEICKLVAQHRRECAASITEFLSSAKGSSFRYCINCQVLKIKWLICRNRVKNVGVNKRKDTEGAVLYWMWRDKRVQVPLFLAYIHYTPSCRIPLRACKSNFKVAWSL